MTQTVETISEKRWREGKRFIYLANIPDLTTGASANLVICTGEHPATVENISIEANVESLAWQPFINSEFNIGTGVGVTPIPRNSVAATHPEAKLTIDPQITADGQQLTASPVNLVAEVLRNNAYYLKETLIDGNFTLESKRCYLIRLTNNSDRDTSVELSMSIANA